jgi:hypothetical protein
MIFTMGPPAVVSAENETAEAALTKKLGIMALTTEEA